MKRPSTCRFICSLLLISLSCIPLRAQEQAQTEEKPSVVSGIAVSADVVGFAMKAVGAKFANMEVGGRIGFLDRYFAVAEVGIGDSHRDGAETDNTFSTTSPYMRFGLDYNFNKKHNGNRLFGLFRYGISSFKYDFENPTFTDPTYGTVMPLELEGEKATAQWLEFGAAVETQLWRFVRIGWSMRYKFRLSLSKPDEGKPYFIPGYGKNDSNAWGGTVNIIFDVGKGAFNFKKKEKK